MLTKPSFKTDDRDNVDGSDYPSAATLNSIMPPNLVINGFLPGEPSESCRFVEANLSAYIDSELDPEQVDLINTHLGKCSHCSRMLAETEEMDDYILREWRNSVPLPSSSEHKNSIDAIMNALPNDEENTFRFPARRVHTRSRWTRLAAGLTGVVAIGGAISTSYWFGYQHGKQSSIPAHKKQSRLHDLKPQRSITTAFPTAFPAAPLSLHQHPPHQASVFLSQWRQP